MADTIYAVSVTAISAIVGYFSFKDMIEQNEARMDAEDADDEAYEIRKAKRRERIAKQSKEDAQQILFDQWAKGLI